MGIEVYIINLVIGIMTFLVLRLTLKKLVLTEKIRIRLTWLGTIILTPIIYLGLITIFFSILFYQPKRDFDKVEWFADRENRYQMRDDIIESGILKEKNKKEIIEIIGLPDFYTDTTNIWNYDLGASGAGLGLQFNTLLVTFDNDRVVKVEKNEILD